MTYLIKIGGFPRFRVYGGEAYAIPIWLNLLVEAHSQMDSALGEEALDGVEPGAGSRGEGEGEAGMARQPSLGCV